MKKRVMILLSFILFLSIGTKVTYAAKDEKGVGFYVSPVIPPTQIDFTRSFLNPQTRPGEEQKLSVHVVNTSSEPKTVKIEINDASSSELGSVVYGEPIVVEESLVDPISKILTTEKDEIVVEPGEDKVVEFKLLPPEQHYEGVKMGAIEFINKTGETIDDMVDVSNSYMIGVVTAEVEEDFRNGSKLEIAEVLPTLNRGRKAVDVHLRNPQSKLIQNLNIDAIITKKGSKEEVMRRKVDNYSLAPNSILPFVFDWGLSNILPGEYTVKMDISNGEHEFNLEKNFTITDTQAKKLNDESPFRINTPNWVKFLSIGLGVLTIFISIFIFIRQNKWNKEVKYRRKRGRGRSKRKGR